jgi:ABC-2 type transport system permease protein
MSSSTTFSRLIRGYKFKTLFLKDLKDVARNTQVFLILSMPIVVVLLYSKVNLGVGKMDPLSVLLMGGLMALCMGPIVIPSTTIAEEKEKNTLRTLMLSNVSPWEFLASKAAVTWLFVVAEQMVVYLIARTGTLPIDIGKYMVIMGCSSMPLIIIGSVIGVMSKNQMSTGMSSAPIMLALMLPTILGMYNEQITRFVRFLPTAATLALVAGGADTMFEYAVLLVWTIFAVALFTVLYRRARLD